MGIYRGYINLGCHSGGPIIRILVFWGLYRRPPILGNYYMSPNKGGYMGLYKVI